MESKEKAIESKKDIILKILDNKNLPFDSIRARVGFYGVRINISQLRDLLLQMEQQELISKVSVNTGAKTKTIYSKFYVNELESKIINIMKTGYFFSATELTHHFARKNYRECQKTIVKALKTMIQVNKVNLLEGLNYQNRPTNMYFLNQNYL